MCTVFKAAVRTSLPQDDSCDVVGAVRDKAWAGVPP
jgi:hypothetical protein